MAGDAGHIQVGNEHLDALIIPEFGECFGTAEGGLDLAPYVLKPRGQEQEIRRQQRAHACPTTRLTLARLLSQLLDVG